MKHSLIFSVLLALFAAAPAMAETSAEIEQRVRAKIDQLLERVLPEGQYSVQVVAQGERRLERELVEGESVTTNPSRAAAIPALPGFSARPVEAGGGGTTRQTFRMRERFDLESFKVQLLLGDEVSEVAAKRASEALNGFLQLEFPGRFQLTEGRAALRPLRASSSWGLSNALPWALLVAGLLGLGAWALVRGLRRPEENPGIHPEVVKWSPQAREEKFEALPGAGGPLAMAPTQPQALPGPDAGAIAFPPLPATEEFGDRRADLIDAFLANAEIFRAYYQKLDESARTELYAGLRGPAFDSLVENLQLSVPVSVVPSVAPTEGQMGFYLQNFREFLKSFEWEERQFFGFLHHLEDSQVLQLVRQQNPLVSGIVLNFLGPERAGRVLDGLTSQQRLQALGMLEHCRQLPISELRAIEESMRNASAEMPRLGSFQQNIDLKFWGRLLTRAQNQDQILLDLEQVRPELYPQLARFRFKFEDIPSLPKSVVFRILDQVENAELSQAMVDTDPSLLEFVLGSLHADRRQLIEHQVLVSQGLSPAIAEESRNSLTRKFREVMA